MANEVKSESFIPIPILDLPCRPQKLHDLGLNYDKYALTLAGLLQKADPLRMTIGIFGGYGSGKTTLMRAMENELKPEDSGIIPVWFNAWRYEHEDSLLLPFFAAIYRELSAHADDPTFTEKIKAAGKGIIRGTTLNIGGWNLNAEKALETEGQTLDKYSALLFKDYTDRYNCLESLTEEKEAPRIVVFIDDLDRCLPDKAFALIEILKSFMDIKGFGFVIGLDPRAIKQYVRNKYKDEFVDTEEYLQKMIQVPFYIPALTIEDTRYELDKALKQLDTKWSQSISLLLTTEGGLGDLKTSFPTNLRQIKRILNMHQSLMAMQLDGIETEPLLALLILQVRWPLAYWALHKLREDFRNARHSLHENRWGLPQNVKDILSSSACSDFIDNQLYLALRKDFSTANQYLQIMGKPQALESLMSFAEKESAV